MSAAAVAAGEALAMCYREIGHTRMASLPICNRALAVEAVGFRACAGAALGVLVTPWCMNLVLLDLPDAPPRLALPAGTLHEHRFPAGTIVFTVTDLAGFGRVDAASLFSPLHDFADQDAARATAMAALEALLTAPPAASTGRRGLLFARGAPA